MEDETYNRIVALMKFERDDLIGWLREYFSTEDFRQHLSDSMAYGMSFPIDIVKLLVHGHSEIIADHLLAKLRDV